ncbi:hypothetical protein HanPSC8_Chr09g0376871 [Helianthus annuus]|nr:hypothetical protein HanPSC8_Chr09g0376871 [Helianthus annuus]
MISQRKRKLFVSDPQNPFSKIPSLFAIAIDVLVRVDTKSSCTKTSRRIRLA